MTLALMNYFKMMISIFVLTFSSKVMAVDIKIACTHEILCLYLDEAIDQSTGRNFTLIKAYNKNADPHHSSISPKLVKIFYKADYIIRGPKLLNPGINSVYNNSKAKKIQLGSNKGNPHFWLSKKTNCSFKKNLRKELIKAKIPLNHNFKCNDFEQLTLIENKIKNITKSKEIILILPHDSFSDYLKLLGFKVYTLNHPGHHKHVDLKTLKLVESFGSNPKINWYWLIDETIENKKYIKSQHKVIKIKLIAPLINILSSILGDLTK